MANIKTNISNEKSASVKNNEADDLQVWGARVHNLKNINVRIPRNKETLEHPQIKNLYPCGEGAGFAGGIVSAAIDGIKCADAVLRNIK